MVGIITFHTAINYGGILQSFALQESIKRLGVAVEIIDYQCPHFEKQYKKVGENPIHKIKKIASAFVKNGILKRNIEGFNRFKKEYLNLSSEYNENNITEANGVYDIFITGSDQVWSPICAGFDKHYFLDFVYEGNKKNSYAASFGQNSIDDSLKHRYKELLSGFNKISVREKSGVLLVKELVDRECECVLDPTLLLSKSEWASYISKIKYPKYEYVLVYMIEEDKDLLDGAKKYAKKYGMKVIYINDRVHKYPGVINLRNVDPDVWVSLFYHAMKVYTNSFHGVVFSLNFNKPFLVQLLPSNRIVGDRITNVLDTFSIMEAMNIELDDKYVFDYDEINNKIGKSRRESMDFLASIVRENDYGE